LQSRIILKEDKHIPGGLVHWESIDAEHTTWEELMLRLLFGKCTESQVVEWVLVKMSIPQGTVLF